MRNSFGIVPSQPSYAYGAGSKLFWDDYMTPAEYLKLSANTDDISKENMDKRRARVSEDKAINDLHAICGLVTEAAELMDAYKKQTFYGKPMDPTNIKEEISDCFWYLALLCRNNGFSFEECMETNIAKLKKRYGEKFTEAATLNRDLAGEYAVLEKVHKTFKIRVNLLNNDKTHTQVWVQNMFPEVGTVRLSLAEKEAYVFDASCLETIRPMMEKYNGVDYIYSDGSIQSVKN